MKSSKFRRPYNELLYRKRFVIATEGSKNKPGYFAIAIFNNSDQQVILVKKKRHKSAPKHILTCMKDYLKKEKLKSSDDEAWLVVDKDDWDEKILDELSAWAKEKKNYGFAFSNPKFEYWLLLHFEDGKKIESPKDMDCRLKKYLPNYNKRINASKFTRERIEEAMGRARKRDCCPRCADWPRVPYVSTVYRLVEKMLPSRFDGHSDRSGTTPAD